MYFLKASFLKHCDIDLGCTYKLMQVWWLLLLIRSLISSLIYPASIYWVPRIRQVTKWWAGEMQPGLPRTYNVVAMTDTEQAFTINYGGAHHRASPEAKTLDRHSGSVHLVEGILRSGGAFGVVRRLERYYRPLHLLQNCWMSCTAPPTSAIQGVVPHPSRLWSPFTKVKTLFIITQV